MRFYLFAILAGNSSPGKMDYCSSNNYSKEKKEELDENENENEDEGYEDEENKENEK